ncbi:MAG: helix-turn-helix transcriptional regulator [Treponema sp.]|nr:helix-turn-helix transcriptional regulator [Treponema sp.]
MYDWNRMLHLIVNEIDERIKDHDDEALTLKSLAKRLGYSEFHATRRFKDVSGMHLSDYIRLRKLAFALIDVRDTQDSLFDIAVKYGFGSHEAFTRSFKTTYGITPKKYRQNPLPVVLRTKLSIFDRYYLGLEEIGMATSTRDVKTYFITLPAHLYLHIKNYESKGYWDFWKKQATIPGQNWDTICGLLDSIKGNLDGHVDVLCNYSGQVMARMYEGNGAIAEGYGIRLPLDYKGPIPENMLVARIPEHDYIVFEHGPFDYEQENETVEKKLIDAELSFDYSKTGYSHDASSGRVGYFYHIPALFKKRLEPVRRR